MDDGVPPSLFVNDGSFMERFKQLQQEQKKNEKLEDSKPIKIVSGSLTPNLSMNKRTSADLKAYNTQKTSQAGSYKEWSIGTPTTRVICIILFMLSVLMSFVSVMQHLLPQVILQ
ncbi:hypothetical protein K1719_036618 [Acacia pycnantha]|nr:hypothetical protein K1719_036618 [Acacia pycnantha]